MKKLAEVAEWDKLSNGGQISHYFWIYGANALESQSADTSVQSRMTLLFHLIKKKWMFGPQIPEDLLLFDSSATSLNSTHVVFIGAKKTTKETVAYTFDSDLQIFQSMRKQPYLTVIFNFATKIWSYLADLPRLTHMDNSFAIYQDCSLLAPLSTVVYIDKEGTR